MSLRESNPVKIRHYEVINRHLILQLYLTLSIKLLKLKPDSQHIVKEVQRLISSVIEDDSLSGDNALIEETFFFQNMHKFF
jgi:hypothetical protein